MRTKAIADLIIIPRAANSRRIMTTDGRLFNYKAIAIAVQIEINKG